MTRKQLQQLKETGKYEDKHFVYTLKPRKQGKVFNGFKGEYTEPKYALRIKVTAKPILKQLLNS